MHYEVGKASRSGRDDESYLFPYYLTRLSSLCVNYRTLHLVSYELPVGKDAEDRYKL